MGENWDKLSGKAKETVGTATDDERLETEGKIDQGKGSVKGAVDDVADAVKDKVGHR